MESLCKIRDVYRAIAEFEKQFQEKHGLCLNEGMLLCSLSQGEAHTSGQMAELLGLSCSNVSKVIASVEKKGLVKRALGKEDKRQMYFQLTAAGQTQLEVMQCCSDDMQKMAKELKGML